MADDGSGERPSEEKREIDEEIVGAEGGAAIFDGDGANGFDGERWKDEREAEADECRRGEGGRGDARETEKEQAEDFDEERNDGDGKSAEAGDESVEKNAGENKRDPIEGKSEGGARPMQLREIEGDKSGENAEAHAAKREGGAVRSNFPEDVGEGQMARRRSGDARKANGERDAGEGDAENQQADGCKSPSLQKKNAEWRADGKCTEGGDAVPGNDFCDVLGASASDAPDGSSRADHAFTDAEEEASDEEASDRESWGRNQEGGGESPEAAGGAGEESIDDDAFGAAGVNHAAGARAGKNGGDILRADDESGEDGAVAELQVSVRGKHGEGNADGEIADEGEGNGGKDLGDGAGGLSGS